MASRAKDVNRETNTDRNPDSLQIRASINTMAFLFGKVFHACTRHGLGLGRDDTSRERRTKSIKPN